MYELKDLAKEINRCLQCNFCLANCPVYGEDFTESSVARGRINLIHEVLVEKNIPLGPRARKIIERCLLCTNCMQGCPSGIPVDDIVIAARSELAKEFGVGLAKKVVFRQVLNKRSVADFASKTLAAAGNLHLTPASLPTPVTPNFEERLSGVIQPVGEKRAKVAYFVGCATNYLYPETGEAVVKVLTENGVEVVIPENLRCCGIPALAHGDSEAALESVRGNAEALAALDVDAIVTDCTSCGYMLKVKALKTLDQDDPWREKAASVANKVVEVTEFITTLGLVKEPNGPPVKATYHVPCHRTWSDKLVEAPRKLAASIPALELVEMKEPQKCCGAGGSFFLEHGELSQSIRQRKLDDINSTEAEYVITQCPSCRMYLKQGLDEKLKVLHPLEVLAQSY